VLKRKHYKQLLVSLDLEGEDRKYVKVGAEEADFDPTALALVEPDTIFLLAKSIKKYYPVIEQLRNETSITQKRVRELITDYRKSRKEKASDTNGSASIWRHTQKGEKYCQIGAIHEKDEFTGGAIQRIVDEKGVPPQTVVRNAMSLVEAYSSGQLVWVNNSHELNNDDQKNFFDVRVRIIPSSVEVPNSSSASIDVESQLSGNDELQGVTSELEVDSSDISEPIDNPNVTEPIVVIDSGANSEVNNDINNSDVSQPVVVYGADSELEEAVIIAEYLSKLETWAEVVAVMENCPGELKLLSWELLDENQKTRLHELKHQFEVSNTKVETNEEILDKTLNPDSLHNLKVGDKVIWDNCYPHLRPLAAFHYYKN
jgi:hypothetical protein